MTIFRVEHPDGTHSDRETVDGMVLKHAVIVYTPAETRQEIREHVKKFDEFMLDNIDRALSDGTVDERDGVTYIGGIQASSVAELQSIYSETAKARQFLDAQPPLPPMYQAVAWFATRETAYRLADTLDEKYINQGVFRNVYVDSSVQEVADDSAGS